MDKPTLLVIDVQERIVPLIIGKQKFIEKINGIIHHFKKNGLPIIFVKQYGAGELYSSLNYGEKDYQIIKKRPSSFTSEEFCDILGSLKTNELFVTGLMSQGCVQATCKGALERNFEVTLFEDGHDSVLKPLRTYYNNKLQNEGTVLIKSEVFLQRS